MEKKPKWRVWEIGKYDDHQVIEAWEMLAALDIAAKQAGYDDYHDMAQRNNWEYDDEGFFAKRILEPGEIDLDFN